MHQFFPDADPEPQVYELLSWDLPGYIKGRNPSVRDPAWIGQCWQPGAVARRPYVRPHGIPALSGYRSQIHHQDRHRTLLGGSVLALPRSPVYGWRR